MANESTPQEIRISQFGDEDLVLIQVDAKDPARPKILKALQAALEAEQRTDEAVRVKAYAQDKMPDDWKRRKSEKPEERGIRRPATGDVRERGPK